MSVPLLTIAADRYPQGAIFFFTNPTYVCSNDQCDEGIILRYVCWGTWGPSPDAPPHPPEPAPLPPFRGPNC